jgi:hypothetical protein
MHTVDLNEVAEDRHVASDDVQGDAEVSEILARIDRHLSVDLRADWLMMRAGGSLSKHKRQAVDEAVREILGADVLA